MGFRSGGYGSYVGRTTVSRRTVTAGGRVMRSGIPGRSYAQPVAQCNGLSVEKPAGSCDMSHGEPRRDGFEGQHLLVLPEPLVAKARRHPLLRGLHVTDAGYFPAAGDHFVQRPRGAPTSLVILCLRGTGWVRTSGDK